MSHQSHFLSYHFTSTFLLLLVFYIFKTNTHLKCECFPDGDQFSAFSRVRGFLNRDRFLSWAGGDRGISSRPQGGGWGAWPYGGLSPSVWQQGCDWLLPGRTPGPNAEGCPRPQSQLKAPLKIKFWVLLVLYSRHGRELRDLVTYISAFESCFKRICSGRNSAISSVS